MIEDEGAVVGDDACCRNRAGRHAGADLQCAAADRRRAAVAGGSVDNQCTAAGLDEIRPEVESVVDDRGRREGHSAAGHPVVDVDQSVANGERTSAAEVTVPSLTTSVLAVSLLLRLTVYALVLGEL